MFCFHKFSEVKKDGFQYCKKCGKAIMPKHEHKLIDISTTEVFGFNNKVPCGYVVLQKCSICGELHNHHVGQTKGWW